jgi:signal peptidase I
MSTGRVIGAAAAALALAALAAGWLLLGPAQAGGGTSYAVVVGSSMEPRLHRGDLAVVRRSETYGPGDVVLYDSRELGSKVLHRIVRVEGGRFVLQGDNNDFLDPERPTADQIVGKLWVGVPAVGRVTEWLREPLHAALLVGLVTLLALGGGAGAGAAVRRGPRPAAQRVSRSDDEKKLLLGLALGIVAAAALAAVSFTRPLVEERTVDAAYAHQGRFAYDAPVPRSPVYPDGRVSTGEPVFLRLVPRLRVSFEYVLESERARGVRGTIALDARLSDGRGWERVLPLAAERRFDGRTTAVDGVLDLRWIERMVDQMRELTGSTQTAFTVAVLPRVEVAGRVGGDAVDASFEPGLSFDLGDLRLQPGLEAEGVGPFAPRETGTGTAVVPAELSLGSLSLDVGTARRVSLLGLALALLGGGLALVARRRDAGDPAVARHAHLIVPVAARPFHGPHVTEVHDLDALARLAEHHGRLILQVGEGDDRSYVVDEGGHAYRFRPAGAPYDPAPVEPAAASSAPRVRRLSQGALIPGAGGARYRAPRRLGRRRDEHETW